MSSSYKQLEENRSSNILRNAFLIVFTLCFVVTTSALVLVAYTFARAQQSQQCFQYEDLKRFVVTGYEENKLWQENLSNPESTTFHLVADQITSTLSKRLEVIPDYRNAEIKKFEESEEEEGIIFKAIISFTHSTRISKEDIKLHLQNGGFALLDIYSVDDVSQKAKTRKHRIVKRSVDSVKTESDTTENGIEQCPPGFTGKFCQYPVCFAKLAPSPVVPGFGGMNTITVNTFTFCSATIPIPVDSYMNALTLTLFNPENPIAYGHITLINPQGNIISTSSYVVIKNTTGWLELQVSNPSPGQWAAQIMMASSCHFISSAEAKTGITISMGFVSGSNSLYSALHSDSPTSSMTVGNGYLVAHGNGLSCPGTMQNIEISNLGRFVYSGPSSQRFHCSYSTYFGPFQCSVAGMYEYKITGLDDNGYPFSRANNFLCLPLNQTTTHSPMTTSVSTAVPTTSSCLNGGYLKNGVCVCPVYYSGLHCEVLDHCANGGTLINGQCLCPPGTNGTVCDNIFCLDSHPPKNFNILKKTMGIVIGIRSTMANDVLNMKMNILNVMQQWRYKHPGNLTNFVIVTYLDTPDNAQKYAFTDFIKASYFIRNLEAKSSFKFCNQPVLSAIDLLLNHVSDPSEVIQPNSPIFVFTDAIPSDYSLLGYLAVKNPDGAQAQINFVITDSNSTSCPLNKNAPGYQSYAALAGVSKGHVIYGPKTTTSNIIYSLYNAMYNVDTLYVNYYDDCSAWNWENDFQVFANGGILVTVSLPFSSASSPPLQFYINGSVITPDMSSSYGSFLMYTFKDATPSVSFNFSSPQTLPRTACMVQVQGETSRRLFLAFTSSIHDDFTTSLPTKSVPVKPVIHESNPGTLLSLKDSTVFAVIFESNDQSTSYISLGTYRNQNCQYNFVFDEYQCSENGRAYYFLTTGYNGGDNLWQRMSVGFCNYPGLDNPCLNGGFMNNGSCLCPQLFTGRFCQNAVCLNGGSSVQYGYISECSCIEGFGGLHCEKDTCINKNPAVFGSPDHKSVAFLVETTSNNPELLSYFQTTIPTIVSEMMSQSKNWIDTWILGTFSDHAFDVWQTSSVSDFLNRVKTLQPSPATTCPTVSGAALVAALSQSSQNGLVFLATQSSMKDYSEQGNIINLMESTKATINVFLGSLNPCNTGGQGPAINIFYDIAFYSDGAVIDSNVAKNVSEALKVIPSFYSSQSVAFASSRYCDNNFYFPIDSHTVSFTVRAFSSRGITNTTVIDPHGKRIVCKPISTSFFSELQNCTVNGTYGVYTAHVYVKSFVFGPDCSIDVRAKTNMLMFAGFTTDLHNDFPTNQPYNITKQTDYMIAHMSNLPSNGRLTSLEFQTKVPSFSKFSPRSGCAYEFVSNGFFCSDMNQNILLATGIDENGYTFQRRRMYQCYPKVEACVHGTRINSTYCFCSPGWYGKNCNNIICYNGGTSLGTICNCPIGYGGDFCQDYSCLSKNPNSTFPVGQKSLVIVTDFSLINSYGLQMLKSSIPNFIQSATSQHFDWFYNYIFVPVINRGSGNFIGNITVTKNPTEFVNAIYAVQIDSNVISCPSPTLEGIATALKQSTLKENSILYLFTQSSPLDTSPMTDIIPMIAQKKIEINVVLGSTQPCNTNFLPHDNAFAYYNITLMSGGSLQFVRPYQTPLYMNYMLTRYSSQQVMSFSSMTCSDTVYIPVDTTMTALVFTMNGEQAAVQFQTTKGSQTLNVAYTLILSNNAQLIGVIKNPPPGIITATIQSSTGACEINFYASTTFLTYYGFTTDHFSDSPSSVAVGGSQNYLMAHVYKTQGQLTSAQLAGLSFIGVLFKPRVSCTYGSLTQGFSCPSRFFKIAIYGKDNSGYTVMRMGTGQCQMAPPSQCLNGGILQQNGACFCPSMYYGAHCEHPICLNGGIVSSSKCMCQMLYTGTHCEIEMCERQNPSVPSGPDHKTFSFLIQNSVTMTYDIQEIHAGISSVLDSIPDNSPNWISTFNLIVFDQTGANLTMTTTSLQLFKLAVMGVKSTLQYGHCNETKLGQGLIKALQNTNNYGSLWVFTDAIYGDIGETVIPFFNLLVSTKATVNFFLSSVNPCGYPMTNSILPGIAKFSGGQMIMIEKSSIPDAMRYIPETYSTGLVNSEYRGNCLAPTYFYFPVDSHTSHFIVVVSGYNTTVTLYDSAGQIHYPRPVLTKSMFTKIYQLHMNVMPIHNATQRNPGIWSVMVQTNPVFGIASDCSITIRAQSLLQYYSGFVTDQHSDFPGKEPVGNATVPNFASVHLTGSNTNINLKRILFLDGAQNIVSEADTYRRVGCGYEWVSQSFHCADQLLYNVASGTDEKGYSWRRINSMACLP